MSLYAVEYVYDPQKTEKIAQVKPEHRAHLSKLYQAGKLQAAGAWLDQPEHPGALLLVYAESAEDALDMLSEDPFLLAQVILERKVRHWQVPIGSIS